MTKVITAHDILIEQWVEILAANSAIVAAATK